MIEKLKKSLAEHGFKTDPEHRTAFIRRSAFLEQTIWEVKLRLLPGQSNIRLGIGYTDSLKKNPFQEIMLYANLQLSEPPQLASPGTYWKQTDEAAALKSLIDFGIPWLEHFSDPKVLTGHLESHLKKTKAPGDHRKLGLLYYEIGELKKACRHTQEWLDEIARGESWAEERARTRRQLKAMKCP